MVKNRDHWTIEQIHDDGTVTVTGRTGTVTLPADYVIGHVELGYAQTSHASQGRTVDTALLLVDTPTDSRGVHTPMTRGRHSNHAYVAIEDNLIGVDVLAHAVSRQWADMPAHRPTGPTPRGWRAVATGVGASTPIDRRSRWHQSASVQTDARASWYWPL
jgi:hypothetical protein